MSEKDSHIVPLYAKDGSLYGILLSPQLWEAASRTVAPILERTLDCMYPHQATERPEPLHEWQEFADYWDFKYPLTAEVECRACGARTDDWEHDPARPFLFKGASLSGLCVFHCQHCQATVRKKHFKDHVCYEASGSALHDEDSSGNNCGPLPE